MVYEIQAALYELFAVQFIKVIIAQFVLSIIAVIIDNHTLVDASWGFIHFMIGICIATGNFYNNAKVNSAYNLIGLILLFIWFVRLSGFILYYRIFNRYVDPRYVREEEKKKN